MANLKWLFIAGIAVYVAFGALMFFAQRALMYFPDRTRTTPAAAGLPQAEDREARYGRRRNDHRLACGAARRQAGDSLFPWQ
jgi:hypothetical protein